MDKDKFVNTLAHEFNEGNHKNETSMDDISSNITKCLNKALEASAKLIPVAPTTNRKLPKEALAINDKIREKEKEKSDIIRNLNGKGPYSNSVSKAIRELEYDIENL